MVDAHLSENIGEKEKDRMRKHTRTTRASSTNLHAGDETRHRLIGEVMKSPLPGPQWTSEMRLLLTELRNN